ncbi:PucR family transcriptional regulator [Actinophytocola sp. KF-1]
MLDRVSLNIPYLAHVTVDGLARENGGAHLTPAAAQGLRAVLGKAAMWGLGCVAGRYDTTATGELDIDEWQRCGISAVTCSAACRDMYSRLWKALSLEAGQADKLLLLERANQFFLAGSRVVESILRAEIDLGTEHREEPALSVDDRRRRITGALLRGERPAEELCGTDIPVADTYVVLAMRSAQVVEDLRPAVEDGWFTARRRTNMLVLVPVQETGADDTPETAAEHAFETLHLPGPAGLALPGSIEEIPAAVDDAQEVVTTLGHLDNAKPGMYRLDDVLLEAMLFRARELSSRLASKVAPVAVQTPHLLDTLEAFLDSDCERRELARQLYIHPNTLSHRLKRVWELTGLSLSSVHDLCLLKVSLMALRMHGLPEADTPDPALALAQQDTRTA